MQCVNSDMQSVHAHVAGPMHVQWDRYMHCHHTSHIVTAWNNAFLQVATCGWSPACNFFVSSNGTLTRSPPECNTLACTNELHLRGIGIRSIDAGVFAGMSKLTGM